MCRYALLRKTIFYYDYNIFIMNEPYNQPQSEVVRDLIEDLPKMLA